MDLKGKKILLVEDDTFIGQMLARRMIVTGADLDWAKNGLEGLDMVNKKDYDIIVSDLMMSQMDGYEMLSKIQSEEKTKDIPVVILTNKTSENESTLKIDELKIKAKLIKSNTDLSQIIKVIEDVLSKNI